jgi:hypothetical protein
MNFPVKLFECILELNCLDLFLWLPTFLTSTYLTFSAPIELSPTLIYLFQVYFVTWFLKNIRTVKNTTDFVLDSQFLTRTILIVSLNFH